MNRNSAKNSLGKKDKLMHVFARASVIAIFGFVILGCSFPEPKALAMVYDSKSQSPDLPRIIKDSMSPYYPQDAIIKGVEGLVLVFSFVDEEGLVRKVQIAESSGHPVLDEAALAPAAQFRYLPATNKQGKAIPVVIKVPINYKIKLPSNTTANSAIQSQ